MFVLIRWRVVLDLRVFGEGVLVCVPESYRISGEFADREWTWQSWAESDDVDRFEAHVTAYYPPRAVLEPSPRCRPAFAALVPCIARLFGRCQRRRVRADSQLVIFVTERDLRHLAGSALRSDEEAAAAFAQWYGTVPSSRRMGSAEVPSIAVDVEGVEVLWRGD